MPDKGETKFNSSKSWKTLLLFNLTIIYNSKNSICRRCGVPFNDALSFSLLLDTVTDKEITVTTLKDALQKNECEAFCNILHLLSA